MEIVTADLKPVIQKAVRENAAEGLLFSGGLDSGIIAFLSPSIKTISVGLTTYGEDRNYIKRFVDNFGIQNFNRTVEIDEAISAIPEVIKILQSFDPAIPNDLVVYFGLKLAREMGINSVATGDGSDEIFAGYSFMENIDDLDGYIKRMSRIMRFSSNDIGDYFDIEIKQPFLDPEVVDFALNTEPALKIKEDRGRKWGKWILRKAFESDLPDTVIWQDKRPLESGSGMSYLREVLAAKISDEEFEKAKRECPVKFMNKEHLYYYRIYKDTIGEVPPPVKDEKACPGCGAGLRRNSFHCKVCGYVLR